MIKQCVKIIFLNIIFCLPLYAWNSVGHRVAVQIAYDHLTPHAKKTFNHYNQALNKVYKPQSIVNAAVWLDGLKFNDISWYNELHYIDLPFSKDGQKLPKISENNALSGIAKASETLTSPKANDFDKGIALRVLIHVIGDIHQPLHATTLVSKEHPKGDEGGNLYAIGDNEISDNLHWYWDQGGGYLVRKKRMTRKKIREFSKNIEKKYPCHLSKASTDPKQWVNESHKLAKELVYQIKPHEKPSLEYQKMAQQLSKQRLALAGCRLAAFLNQKDNEIAELKEKIQISKY